ncbi:MAG: hypothetical protein J3Q66DRAFT_401522 [Benniella sp.]|nr:MAG: hypothetical protein J3Q66DRAFT_401522 [Benniella sp.]
MEASLMSFHLIVGSEALGVFRVSVGGAGQTSTLQQQKDTETRSFTLSTLHPKPLVRWMIMLVVQPFGRLSLPPSSSIGATTSK